MLSLVMLGYLVKELDRVPTHSPIIKPKYHVMIGNVVYSCEILETRYAICSGKKHWIGNKNHITWEEIKWVDDSQ
jgi:hypothetical protein